MSKRRENPPCECCLGELNDPFTWDRRSAQMRCRECVKEFGVGTPIEYWCNDCGRPIIEDDIDARHSDKEGEDVHADCCEECDLETNGLYIVYKDGIATVNTLRGHRVASEYARRLKAEGHKVVVGRETYFGTDEEQTGNNKEEE